MNMKKACNADQLGSVLNIKNNNSYTKKKDTCVKRIIRCGRLSLFNSDTIKINWVLTRKCNYSCSYCTVKDKNAPFPSEDMLNRIIHGISNLDKNRINITITGGEPTLDPNYFYILSLLFQSFSNNKTINVNTITNLGQQKNFYDKLTKKFSDYKDNMRFVASYHFEFADTEKFISNSKILAEAGFKVNVLLLGHPQYMDKVHHLYETLNSLSIEKLTVKLKLVRDHFGSVPDKRYAKEDLEWISRFYDKESKSKSVFVDIYDPDQNKIFRDYFNPNELIILNLHKFKGMMCNAGVNMITIDENGFLDSAVCLRGKKGSKKLDISSDPEAFEKIKGPIICPFESCTCLADIPLPKYINGFENVDTNQIETDIHKCHSMKLGEDRLRLSPLRKWWEKGFGFPIRRLLSSQKDPP